MRVLDAGCGFGRNLVYFLREGYDAFGVDADAGAIDSVRELAAALAPNLPADHFRMETVEAMSFQPSFADFVISNAVLHFAFDDQQFAAMLYGTWRMLKPGGLFFCRLASNIGMERNVRQIEGRRYLLPDGSERYLVDEELLSDLSGRMGGQLIDPIKTTVVQNQRCMTTWVLRKSDAKRMQIGSMIGMRKRLTT